MDDGVAELCEVAGSAMVLSALVLSLFNPSITEWIGYAVTFINSFNGKV